jgi:hypothetical protein
MLDKEFDRSNAELDAAINQAAEEHDDEQRLAYLAKRIRHLKALSQGVMGTIGLVVVFFVLHIGIKPDSFLYDTSKAAEIIGAGVLFLTRLVIDVRVDDLKAEQKTILARRRVDEQLPEEELRPQILGEPAPSIDYFDKLVKINVENLSAYYELVKIQTDKSFKASLWVAYFGALLIIVGLGLGFMRTDATDKITYIATGAGILTEFISGVFFWLFTKTVRQLRGYHDSLLAVQNILLSFKLVSETRDPKEKSQMVGMMCEFLLSGHTKQLPGKALLKRAAAAQQASTDEAST